ncbi:MAG: hypothetical protein HY291_21360 [Planctomycetes bacterium]|nr:hypothetical protein [Planctomycetota bacterium]
MSRKRKGRVPLSVSMDTSKDAKGFIKPAEGRKLKEVLYDHFNYKLYECEDGSYELEIVANKSAAYYIYAHVLTDGETSLYKKRGKKYIDALANKYRNC